MFVIYKIIYLYFPLEITHKSLNRFASVLQSIYCNISNVYCSKPLISLTSENVNALNKLVLPISFIPQITLSNTSLLLISKLLDPGIRHLLKCINCFYIRS